MLLGARRKGWVMNLREAFESEGLRLPSLPRAQGSRSPISEAFPNWGQNRTTSAASAYTHRWRWALVELERWPNVGHRFDWPHTAAEFEKIANDLLNQVRLGGLVLFGRRARPTAASAPIEASEIDGLRLVHNREWEAETAAGELFFDLRFYPPLFAPDAPRRIVPFGRERSLREVFEIAVLHNPYLADLPIAHRATTPLESPFWLDRIAWRLPPLEALPPAPFGRDLFVGRLSVDPRAMVGVWSGGRRSDIEERRFALRMRGRLWLLTAMLFDLFREGSLVATGYHASSGSSVDFDDISVVLGPLTFFAHDFSDRRPMIDGDSIIPRKLWSRDGLEVDFSRNCVAPGNGRNASFKPAASHRVPRPDAPPPKSFFLTWEQLQDGRNTSNWGAALDFYCAELIHSPARGDNQTKLKKYFETVFDKHPALRTGRNPTQVDRSMSPACGQWFPNFWSAFGTNTFSNRPAEAAYRKRADAFMVFDRLALWLWIAPDLLTDDHPERFGANERLVNFNQTALISKFRHLGRTYDADPWQGYDIERKGKLRSKPLCANTDQVQAIRGAFLEMKDESAISRWLRDNAPATWAAAQNPLADI